MLEIVIIIIMTVKTFKCAMHMIQCGYIKVW